MKKTEIPTNDPGKLSEKVSAQKPSNNTRAQVKAKQTDRINPNSGPLKRNDKN